MFEILIGLLGKGVHSVYKDIELETKVQNAGHRLLIDCKSPGEVIRTKCVFIDKTDMPRLTDDELNTIENWYRDNGGVSREVMMGYYNQTGKNFV